MKDLTIPIPNDGNIDMVEVDVKVGDKKIQYHFRVESFPWINEKDIDEEINITESFEKIERLKNIIKEYNSNWELIQIFTPRPKASHIQLLFRQKKEPEMNN